MERKTMVVTVSQDYTISLVENPEVLLLGKLAFQDVFTKIESMSVAGFSAVQIPDSFKFIVKEL